MRVAVAMICAAVLGLGCSGTSAPGSQAASRWRAGIAADWTPVFTAPQDAYGPGWPVVTPYAQGLLLSYEVSDGGGEWVTYQHFDQNACPVGAPLTLPNSGETVQESHGAVAVGDSFVVIDTKYGGARNDLEARLLFPDGGFGAAQDLCAGAPELCDTPYSTALASNGTATLVAWLAPQDAGLAVAGTFLDGAMNASTPQVLFAVDGGFRRIALAAQSGGGDFMLAVSDINGSAVDAVTVHPDGGAELTASIPITWEPYYSDPVSIATDGARFMLAWADSSSGSVAAHGMVIDQGSDAGRLELFGSTSNAIYVPAVSFDGDAWIVAAPSDDGSGGTVTLLVDITASSLTVGSPSSSPFVLDGAGISGDGVAVGSLPTGVSLVAAVDRTADGGAQIDTFRSIVGGSPCSTSSSGSTGGSTGSTGSTGSSGSTGGSSSGSTTSSGGSTTSGSSSSTGGASTSSGTSSGSTGTSGAKADYFGCSAGGAGFAPLALLGLLALARRRRGTWVLGAVLFAAPVARADAPRKPQRAQIAVLDFKNFNVDPAILEVVTTRLVAQIQNVTGRGVISSGDVRNALGLEKTRELLGCSESSCMAELGGALGVELLVNGTLAKLGKARTFDVQLMDVRRAVVIARYSHRLPDTAGDDGFLDEVEPAVAALFPNAAAPRPTASAAAPAPIAEATPSVERPIVAGVLAAAELTARGGMLEVRGGYRFAEPVAVQAGAIVAASGRAGATLGLEAQPFNARGTVRPLVELAGEAFFGSASSLGATLGAGVEWEPTPGFTLRAELPATYLFSAPADTRGLYLFGGVGAGLRL